MRPPRHWTDPRLRGDDRGSAPVEFIAAGLLLLVPLLYLMVALGSIQHQALGAAAMARHVARAVSTASDAGEARVRGGEVLEAIAAQYGIDPRAIEVEIRCAPAGATCPTAGAALSVVIRVRASLPLAPPVLELERLASVPIETQSVQRVSRFWSGS